MLVALWPLLGMIVCLVLGVFGIFLIVTSVFEEDPWLIHLLIIAGIICMFVIGTLCGIYAFGYQIVPNPNHGQRTADMAKEGA